MTVQDDCIGAQPRKNLRLTAKTKIFVDEIAPHVPDPQPYGNDSELFQRIVDFLKKNVILGDPETYEVVAAWVLLTWRIEHTNVAPYLYVTAPRGHGKTRLLETLEQIVRRPLVASYATRGGLMRCLDRSNATLLLDEGEHYVNPQERRSSDLKAILNAGYRRGAHAIMVADVTETLPDGTKRTIKKPVKYDVFSAKCIVSRKSIPDTLEDRSVQIVMPKANHRLPPIDKAEGEKLRGQLAQYRIDSLTQNQPLQVELPETGEARLSEILEPLCAITPVDRRSVYRAIINRERALRLERIQNSYEFRVLEALDAVVTDADKERSLILTESITNAYNQHHENNPTNARNIGRVLARFGFQADREDTVGPNGERTKRRGYRLNRALLAKLETQYGVDPGKPSATPTPVPAQATI